MKLKRHLLFEKGEELALNTRLDLTLLALCGLACGTLAMAEARKLPFAGNLGAIRQGFHSRLPVKP